MGSNPRSDSISFHISATYTFRFLRPLRNRYLLKEFTPLDPGGKGKTAKFYQRLNSGRFGCFLRVAGEFEPGAGFSGCRQRVPSHRDVALRNGRIYWLIHIAQELRSGSSGAAQILRSHSPKSLVLRAFQAWHIICRSPVMKHPVSLKDTRVLSNVKPQQDLLK